MWVLIAILCVIMMSLVCFALMQLKELKDKEINAEINKLRQLRRQDINNNIMLINENRKLKELMQDNKSSIK